MAVKITIKTEIFVTELSRPKAGCGATETKQFLQQGIQYRLS